MNRATGRVLYATPYYRGTFYKPGSLVIARGRLRLQLPQRRPGHGSLASAQDPGQPPGPGDAPAAGPLELLYPRRIARDRGYDLRFWFAVDRNLPEENAKLERGVAEEGLSSRTVIASYGFDEMPEVYRRADIVAIPSPYSEGTSFSCVEALASGCAVVATNVGGPAGGSG
ncbi:MAG: glycosyltransferase family 4 protein [Bacillota bacterium]|nr:glycosyltransferase family 4 protein [Bacillota bacterium]